MPPLRRGHRPAQRTIEPSGLTTANLKGRKVPFLVGTSQWLVAGLELSAKYRDNVSYSRGRDWSWPALMGVVL